MQYSLNMARLRLNLSAAKVLDVIVRLLDCAGHAIQIAQNSKVRMTVFHDTRDPNHGQTLKTQWFLLNDVGTDTQTLVSCGKNSSRNFFWN